jgi:NMD protein affecting ribosome stability and mRNA decay
MSLLKCGMCQKRMIDGVNHVYWFAPTPGAQAFRVMQRLCTDCLAVNVESLLTPEDADLLTCSACGINVEEDVYPIYVTWYTKGNSALRGSMALCEEHQLELKVRAANGATELPDRYIETPDQVVAQPAPPATVVYAALGRADYAKNRKQGFKGTVHRLMQETRDDGVS